MSKLYNTYLHLKEEEPNIFYIFKSGLFYIFLDEDAKNISKVLNLKITQLNENVVKCGFPSSVLSKYVALLNTQNINYKIIESNSIAINSIEDYVKNVDALQIVKKIQDLDLNIISPIEALKILYDLKEITNEKR